MKAVETLTVEQAAKIIGKSGGYVRAGLIAGRLPFGSAVQKGTNTKWDFNIIKSKLLDYADVRGLDDVDLGDVARLRTRQYIAYRVPEEILREKLSQEPICSQCGHEHTRVWLVANNDNLYCDDCLRKLEDKLDGFICNWKKIRPKVVHYDNLFKT